MVIYSVINSIGEKVGNVQYDGSEMYLTNKEFTNYFNTIDEMFYYLESNRLHLIDGEGDMYNRKIHNELIKNIEKIGIGYFCR
ncbi:hypothetical protein [Clostridium butyricum]|uniref:hypothetical protein n=1 Tax=Clostridium butyricum TaxID=1492 RepID=UPI00325B4615